MADDLVQQNQQLLEKVKNLEAELAATCSLTNGTSEEPTNTG